MERGSDKRRFELDIATNYKRIKKGPHDITESDALNYILRKELELPEEKKADIAGVVGDIVQDDFSISPQELSELSGILD